MLHPSNSIGCSVEYAVSSILRRQAVLRCNAINPQSSLSKPQGEKLLTLSGMRLSTEERRAASVACIVGLTAAESFSASALASSCAAAASKAIFELRRFASEHAAAVIATAFSLLSARSAEDRRLSPAGNAYVCVCVLIGADQAVTRVRARYWEKKNLHVCNCPSQLCSYQSLTDCMCTLTEFHRHPRDVDCVQSISVYSSVGPDKIRDAAGERCASAGRSLSVLICESASFS